MVKKTRYSIYLTKDEQDFVRSYQLACGGTSAVVAALMVDLEPMPKEASKGREVTVWLEDPDLEPKDIAQSVTDAMRRRQKRKK